MATNDRWIAEQDAYERKIEGWVSEAFRDGVARVVARAYLGAWSRCTIKPEFSGHPFSVACEVMEFAYPSREDNDTVTLYLMDQIERRFASWWYAQLRKHYPDRRTFPHL